jgi:leucyl aminopeptidase
MSNSYFDLPQPLLLQPAQPGQALPALTFQFQPAPESPDVSQPGKQAGDILLRVNADGSQTALVSLGKPGKADAETLRQAGGAMARWLTAKNVSAAAADLSQIETAAIPGALNGLLEGLLLGAFRFDRYKKQETPATRTALTLTGGFEKDLPAAIQRAAVLARAVCLARDWAHEPASVINPLTLAERAEALAKKFNLKYTVLDDKALTEMGAGAIVAVGQGSKTPSRLIALE